MYEIITKKSCLLIVKIIGRYRVDSKDGKHVDNETCKHWVKEGSTLVLKSWTVSETRDLVVPEVDYVVSTKALTLLCLHTLFVSVGKKCLHVLKINHL